MNTEYMILPSHSLLPSILPPCQLLLFLMVPELDQRPRVTEIMVRMDCNGCVQKIKKALHGINGIYDLYIDFPQQKLTVVGWADPEKIVKAIKKTRKTATICAHREATVANDQPTEPAPAEGPPVPDAGNPPPTDPPPPEVTPSPEATISGPNDVEHHPHDYSYGHSEHWNDNPNGHGFQPESPVYVTHSYNTCNPSPYIAEYEYVRSPPRQSHYSRTENYSDDYHNNRDNNGNGNNITSMFSDENPNACRIV